MRALRQQQMRNFLATLLLSQGVPMICGGDEIARTQFGNNNAYCQDNELSWFSWTRSTQRPSAHDSCCPVTLASSGGSGCSTLHSASGGACTASETTASAWPVDRLWCAD